MAQMSEIQERNWAMGCHLIALAGFVFPFGNIIGPLIFWQIKKDESEFIADQGKESLNFQISIILYSIIAAFLILFIIGIPLLIAILAFDLIMIIIAGLKANEGQRYRYPLTLRLVQ